VSPSRPSADIAVASKGATIDVASVADPATRATTDSLGAMSDWYATDAARAPTMTNTTMKRVRISYPHDWSYPPDVLAYWPRGLGVAQCAHLSGIERRVPAFLGAWVSLYVHCTKTVMGIFPWCLARLLLAAHGGQGYLRRGWRRRLLTEIFRFDCERLELAGSVNWQRRPLAAVRVRV
jgi:hypothetical protein